MLEPENKEFVRLIKAVGWSQNEAARRLHMTGGGVSQICTGRVRPSKGRLNLLRLLVERENPNAIKSMKYGVEDWATDLVDDLRRMPDGQRTAVLGAMRTLVKALARRPSAAARRKG